MKIQLESQRLSQGAGDDARVSVSNSRCDVLIWREKGILSTAVAKIFVAD